MANISQSAALAILKFDDVSGTLIHQTQLGTNSPAGEKDLYQWRDAAGNALASIAYNPAQGYTAYLKIYDTVYTPGFPYGTYFKGTHASINTFGTKVYFDGNSSATPVSWAFRDSGYNEGLTVTNHGLTLTTGSAYTGGLTVLSSNSTYVPLSVKGASSQTGSLQEWQNSAGTVLARVNAYGDFFITGGRIMRGPNDYGANLNITNETDIKALIIRANASQTLNLTEWQNSSGTTLTYINSSGGLTATEVVGSTTYSGGKITGGTLGYLNASTFNASVSPIVVRGAVNQTANLQEWQYSSGAAAASINSNGALTTTAIFNGGAAYYSATANLKAAGSTESALVLRGTTSQTADLQQWQNSSGTVLVSIDSSGMLYANNNAWISNLRAGDRYNWANAATINILNAQDIPGIIVKAYGAQTANLTEWRNTSGQVITSIGSSGGLSLNYANAIKLYNTANTDYASLWMDNGSGGVNLYTKLNYRLLIGNMATDTGAWLTVSTTGATQVGQVIRAYTSQSANLQEWQDPSGTALTYIRNDGLIYTTTGINATGAWASSLGGVPISGTILHINTAGSANKGLIVKGVSSQSANLQEWQDSAGTVYNSVASDGTFKFKNNVWHKSVTDSQDRFYYESYANSYYKTANGHIFRNSSDTNLLTINNIGNVLVNGFSSSTVGLTVKAAVSQTANLQEWQDSNGNVAAKVASNGYITAGIVYANSNHYAGFQIIGGRSNAVLDSSAAMGMVNWNNSIYTLQLRNSSSQTADSIRIENNSGTAIARIDANGNLFALSKSFDIPHPTKENMRLRYASLEGSENGVYIRGTTTTNIIELPDYWTGLVHEDSITVSLTPVGSAQNIYVEKIEDNKVYIGGNLEKTFFTVYGERKDIDKLTVEYIDPSLPERPRS